MKDLLLIENTNNLILQNKDLQLTNNDVDYTVQKCIIILKVFKGEWYLNINIGIPYFENIFIKNPNIGLIEDIFKTIILSIETIEELIDFNLTYNNTIRKLSLDFQAKLIDGSIINVSI